MTWPRRMRTRSRRWRRGSTCSPRSAKGSRLRGLKELRPGSSGSTEIRVLFVFDPWRSAILLVGGDKSGNWTRWYRTAIPRAERLFEEYLRERTKEEEAGG
jgi:hypothetical protein